MSLRETVNRNPKQAAIAVGGIVLLAVIVIAWQVMGGPAGGDGVTPSSRLYYTTDNGKTWFADSFDKLTPFDYGGKEAVRVHVYECEGEGEFAAYLERVNPSAHKRIADLKSKGDAVEVDAALTRAMEVMRPSDSGWTAAYSKAGRAIATPICPGGSGGRLTPVVP